MSQDPEMFTDSYPEMIRAKVDNDSRMLGKRAMSFGAIKTDRDRIQVANRLNYGLITEPNSYSFDLRPRDRAQ